MTTTPHDFLVGAVTGITSGFFAAWLAIWQGRVQRSWEKKETAYLELLDAMHVLNSNNAQWLDAYLAQRDLTEERQTKLRAEWAQAKEIVARHAELAPLLTSASVGDILQILIKALDQRHEDYYLHLDSDAAHLRKSLTAIKSEAIKERRTVPWLWLSKPKWRTAK